MFPDLTIYQILILAVIGFAGGIVHSVVKNRGVLLVPHVLPDKRICLGFLTSGVIGLATAIIVDGNWVTAFSAAVAGPHIIEGLIETKTLKKPPPE